MSKEYEYTFVRVKVRGGLFDQFATAYQGVIEEHARKGWRFVQAYSPASQGAGRSIWCDLIFEREIE